LTVACSEWYPTLATVVFAQADREEILFGDRFFRQTILRGD